MNCNKKPMMRRNMGGMMPGMVGVTDDMIQQQGSDYASQLMALSQGNQPQQQQPLGQVPQGWQAGAQQAAAKPRGKVDWGATGRAALLGSLAGFGGNKGIVAAPLMMLLDQLLGGKFKKASSGRTPAYNPNNPYGDGRGSGG